jgi:signal transduction histidine kinase
MTLSHWIVPTILKRLYVEWGAGFWAAELYLLFAIALGPALLGFLYMNTVEQETTSRKEADLYSDLLMHDISNYLQALLISFDLIGDDDTDDVMKQMALRDARDMIVRGENLVRNVRRMTQKTASLPAQLKAISLIDTIHRAFKETVHSTSSDEIAFTIRTREVEAYALAQDSLKDVFLNILSNSVMYSDEFKQIEVYLESYQERGVDYWKTRVVDYGKGIAESVRLEILNATGAAGQRSGLGLAVALQLITSFGGILTINSRDPDDYSQGTSIEILLKKAPEIQITQASKSQIY